MFRIALQWPFVFYFILFPPRPPAAYFAHFFISPRASFDTPWQWLRSINHPFPWTVSACLLWDETTAISSSAPPTPALFFCLAFLPKPPTPSNRTQFSAFQTIWFVFRQSTETESVMLIKDDMSEIYATNARLWFNASSIRHLLNRANMVTSFHFECVFSECSVSFQFKDIIMSFRTFFKTFPERNKMCLHQNENFRGCRLPK